MANLPIEIIQLPDGATISGDEYIPAWQVDKTVKLQVKTISPLKSVNDKTPDINRNINLTGSDIPTDTTNFNSVLTPAEDTVQKALDKLDNLDADDIPTDISNFNAILGPEDNTVQKALDKLDHAIIIAGEGGSWGAISGTLSQQVDLQSALDNKFNKSGTTVFVQNSQMSGYQPAGNYLTTAAQSNHSHSQYLTTQTVQPAVASVNSSSGNIVVSGGSNITISNNNGTVIVNGKTDFPYINTSQSSLFEPAGDYLTTAMASNAGSNFVNTSQSSLFEQKSHTSIFQQLSGMSQYQTTGDYLTTAMASNQGSNFVNTSQSSLFEQKSHTSIFQQTSGMTAYQSTGAYLTTAMASNAGSNFVNTSQSSVFQQTSGMSNYQSTGNYLTTAMASDAGSNFVNTSVSSAFEQKSHTSIFQQTSEMTAFQLINNMSNYEAVSHTSVFQQTSQMSLYALKSRINGGTP